MRRFVLVILTSILSLVGGINIAAAEQETDGDDGVEDIVIVEFEVGDVDEDVLDEFYGRLRNAIVEHPTLEIGETGQASMDDLLLMAGCDEPTPDCLDQIGGIVQGRHLLFGAVETTEQGYDISMTLFDFQEQRHRRQIDTAPLRGDREAIMNAIPGVVEHLVYGETAELRVDIQGIPEAEVFVDGKRVGTGPDSFGELAPGQVEVMAVSSDETEKRQQITLRHEQTAEVAFEFEPAIEAPSGPMASPRFIPGVAVSAIGVAGAALGAIGQVNLTAANQEAETLIVGDGDERALGSADDIAAADSLQQDMTQWNTMRWIGFGSGLVGLVGGGFLLYSAFTSDAGGDEMALGNRIDVDLAPTSQGVNAGVRIRF